MTFCFPKSNTHIFSSIIATLFRLTPPSGSMRIDGIETGNISLNRLRRSLAIIPQEPVLFSGSIRRNLDPFNEKADEELWSALEKVQLKAKILTLPGKLDSLDGVENLSIGQRQLICLARAILRRNKILVHFFVLNRTQTNALSPLQILDEATANVDPKTDNLIQQTIRVEFAQCTVITIAHRLNTIIDYDRILVLDAGYLRQFDAPYDLIKKRKGIFFELFDNLSSDMKDELLRLAQKAKKDRSVDDSDEDADNEGGNSSSGDDHADNTYID